MPKAQKVCAAFPHKLQGLCSSSQVRTFLGLYHLAGHVDLVARRWAGSTSEGGAYSMRLANSCTSVFNTGKTLQQVTLYSRKSTK